MGFHMLSIILFVLLSYRNVVQVTSSYQVHHTIAPPNFTLFLQSLLPALIRVFHYFSLALFK